MLLPGTGEGSHGGGARAASVPDRQQTRHGHSGGWRRERGVSRPRIAYVALGSNLDDPSVQVARASQEIGNAAGTRAPRAVLAVSHRAGRITPTSPIS